MGVYKITKGVSDHVVWNFRLGKFEENNGDSDSSQYSEDEAWAKRTARALLPANKNICLRYYDIKLKFAYGMEGELLKKELERK